MSSTTELAKTEEAAGAAATETAVETAEASAIPETSEAEVIAIALAEEFCAQPGITEKQFAEDKGISVYDLRDRLKLAGEIKPELGAVITAHKREVSRRNATLIMQDYSEVFYQRMSFVEFWERHQKLKVTELANLAGDESFCQCLEREIGNLQLKGAKDIHCLARTLGSTFVDDLADSLRTLRNKPGLASIRSFLGRAYRYVDSFRNFNTDSFIGTKLSVDGGKTFYEITAADVERAKAEIRAQHGVICFRTVKECIRQQLT